MEKAKTKTRKTLQIVFNVIIWLFVVFAVVVTILVIASQSDSDGVPSLGGKCFINIVSPSMSPTINEGDLVIGERLSEEQKQTLEVGEIITFKGDIRGTGVQELNTHRIIRINYDENGVVVSYVTKGDNEETNPVEDRSPVPWQNVICRYTGKKFGAVGGILSFLQTKTGFLVIIVIPLLLFFLYELYRFIATLRGVRGKGKKVITAEDEELIKQKAIEEFLRQQAEAKAAEEAAANVAEGAAAQITETVENVAETAENTAESVETAVEETAENAEAAVEETVEKAESAVEETVEEVVEEAAPEAPAEEPAAAEDGAAAEQEKEPEKAE